MPDLSRTSPDDLATVRQRLEAALSEQGFGVLTEIDVQGVFAKKLDVKHEGHQILGACNPGFAKEALDIDRDVALLLPCPITLREVDGGTEVRVLDPERAFTLASDDARERLAPLAREVRDRLEQALQATVPGTHAP